MDYEGGKYREYNPDWHAGDSTWKALQVQRMIERNDIRPHSVLEIGCGAGGVLASMASPELLPATEFLGIDVSTDAITQATRSHGNLPSLRFEVGEVGDVHDVFDLVLLIDVIEHVEDYFTLLRATTKVGRNVILHIPIDMTVSSAFRRHLITDARESVGHIHVFNRDTARATLGETGFQIVDEEYTAGSLDLPAKTLKSRLASIPRRAVRLIDPDLAANLLGGFSLLLLAQPRTPPHMR